MAEVATVHQVTERNSVSNTAELLVSMSGAPSTMDVGEWILEWKKWVVDLSPTMPAQVFSFWA